MEMLDLSRSLINPDSYCLGCTTEEEKAAILRSVEYVATHCAHLQPVFIEVGTLWGGTAEAIARCLLTLRRRSIFWTIDKDEYGCAPARLRDFIHPVEAQAVRGVSWKIAPTVPDPLMWVFIDGDHTEKAVAKDIAAFAPRIQPDGLLLFHDTNHGQGTLNAIVKFDALHRNFELVYEIAPLPKHPYSTTAPWGGLQIYQRRG